MYDNVEGAKEVFVNVSQTSNLLLAVDERFLKHSQSVIISIDGVIKHLKDDAAYEDKLYELVHQHLLLVDPPVTEIYFERFRDKFHLFVTEMTGLPENSEACELWYQFLDAVARCCKRERYMMAEKEKSKASCTNCCSML